MATSQLPVILWMTTTFFALLHLSSISVNSDLNRNVHIKIKRHEGWKGIYWEASSGDFQRETAGEYDKGIWYLCIKFQRMQNSIKKRFTSQAIQCSIRILIKLSSKGHKLPIPERSKTASQRFHQTPELNLLTNKQLLTQNLAKI